MNNRYLLHCLSVMLVALVLSACSRENPEAMISSAKSYLAKSDANAAAVKMTCASDTPAFSTKRS